MKKIVRNSVFETNSSSAHSISLANDSMDFVMDTIYPDQDGKITVYGEEFGWEWRKYNDAMTKLAYVLQDQGNHYREMIEEVVKEQTGAEDLNFIEGGYIDHNSCGTASEVCYSKESLRQFIFNKNSWLFTGNDNGEPDPMFYDVPVFKGGRMINPVYKYELVVEGLEQTTKYKEYPSDEELANGIDSVLDDALLNENGYFILDKSIHWQITRPRDFYKKDWNIDQDYSTGEIRFLKEDDHRLRDIEKDVKLNNTAQNYFERHQEITRRALEVPGLVKKVKFELKKL